MDKRLNKIAFRLFKKTFLAKGGGGGTFVGDGKLTNYQTKDDSSILRQLAKGEPESLIHHHSKKEKSRFDDKWKGNDEHIVERKK
jgi:hypothetical protein